MELQITEVQELIDSIGEVFKARNDEKALVDVSGDEAHASDELAEAFKVTSGKLDAFKKAVAEKIQSAGVSIVQEGDAAPATGDYVTIPQDVDCTCG